LTTMFSPKLEVLGPFFDRGAFRCAGIYFIPLTMLNLLRNKHQVSPAPYIFFHSPSGHRWEEGMDLILLNCRSINEEAVQYLLLLLSVNVSQLDALLAWLGINDILA